VAPYTSKMCNNLQGSGKVIYSLYGVVEHSGRLNGGHYNAYIKARPKQSLEKLLGKKRLTVLKPTVNISDTLANLGETKVCSNNNESTRNSDASTWYYISDTSVSQVPESKILKLQAYILFYERVSINK
jgi:ubiquitin carboxyl-terminal hydrolase 16/45